MKLKRTTPEIYKVPLDECSTDIAFRFPDDTGYAYMKLPYDGSDMHALYHIQTGSEENAIETIIDNLAIHNEDLYVFDESENDQGVVDAEWAEDSLEEFRAFISLTTGHILLTHRDELVVPLNAELTVEDMRSPK
jgi:hypothetical protein